MRYLGHHRRCAFGCGPVFGCIDNPRPVIILVRTPVAEFGAPVLALFLMTVAALYLMTIAALLVRTVAALSVVTIAALVVWTVAALVVLAMALLAVVVLAAVALGLLAGVLFALRFAQKARVVFGVLEKVLLGDTVIRQLRITGEHQVFVDDLLRRAAHLSFGSRGIEDAVDDVAKRARAVRFRTRAGFR